MAGHREFRLARAAINQHGYAHALAAGETDEVEAFLHPPTASNDVFDHEDFFARGEHEAAPHDEDVVFFFGKEVATLGLSRDFLPDDETTHAGCQHGRELEMAQFLVQQSTEPFDFGHVLADLGALEKMPAVEPRAQHEMPLQERPGARENLQGLLFDSIHAKKRCGIQGEKGNHFHQSRRHELRQT